MTKELILECLSASGVINFDNMLLVGNHFIVNGKYTGAKYSFDIYAHSKDFAQQFANTLKKELVVKVINDINTFHNGLNN